MQDSIDLIELSQIIWRRKGMIIVCGIAVGLISLVISLVMPKEYIADTSIIITESAQAKSLSGFAATAFGVAGLSRPSKSNVSFKEVLRSRNILLKVIDKNNLREYYNHPTDKSRDQHLMREMRENLTISPVRDNVLHLSYVARDSEMASQIANSFIEQLSEFLQIGTSIRAVHTRSFISEQIDTIQNELEIAEEKLKTFSAEEEAVGLDEQIVQMVRNAADIKALRISDEIALSLTHDSIRMEKDFKKTLAGRSLEIEDRFKKYEEVWREPGNLLSSENIKYADLSELPDEFLVDSAVSQLRTHLTDLKIQVLAEKITKTEKHPDVVRLNNEIFKTRDLFINEVGNVLDARLATLEFTRIELEAQIAAYDHVLKGFEENWQTLPDKSMRFIRLKRDVEALSQIYLLLKKQLAEAEIDVVREEDYFNVLDYAVPPDKPGKPKPLKNTLVGIILGIVFGTGWVYYMAIVDVRKRRKES
ncbi:hypothetical protein J7L05_07140 [bacterium]|nr:hypothetical protein [bacterium]